MQKEQSKNPQQTQNGPITLIMLQSKDVYVLEQMLGGNKFFFISRIERVSTVMNHF